MYDRDEPPAEIVETVETLMQARELIEAAMGKLNESIDSLIEENPDFSGVIELLLRDIRKEGR